MGLKDEAMREIEALEVGIHKRDIEIDRLNAELSALASRPTQSDVSDGELAGLIVCMVSDFEAGCVQDSMQVRPADLLDQMNRRKKVRTDVASAITTHVASALRAKEAECVECLKRSLEALSEAREMLGVFEDNGGHDGLGGKGYLATIDHMDEARKANRQLLASHRNEKIKREKHDN